MWNLERQTGRIIFNDQIQSLTLTGRCETEHSLILSLSQMLRISWESSKSGIYHFFPVDILPGVVPNSGDMGAGANFAQHDDLV